MVSGKRSKRRLTAGGTARRPRGGEGAGVVPVEGRREAVAVGFGKGEGGCAAPVVAAVEGVDMSRARFVVVVILGEVRGCEGFEAVQGITCGRMGLSEMVSAHQRASWVSRVVQRPRIWKGSSEAGISVMGGPGGPGSTGVRRSTSRMDSLMSCRSSGWICDDDDPDISNFMGDRMGDLTLEL